jgi:hypothetical protein
MTPRLDRTEVVFGRRAGLGYPIPWFSEDAPEKFPSRRFQAIAGDLDLCHANARQRANWLRLDLD